MSSKDNTRKKVGHALHLSVSLIPTKPVHEGSSKNTRLGAEEFLIENTRLDYTVLNDHIALVVGFESCMNAFGNEK